MGRLDEQAGPPPRQGVLLPPNTAAPTLWGVLALVLPHCPGFLLFSVAVASALPSLAPFSLPFNAGVPWSLGGFTDSCHLKDCCLQDPFLAQPSLLSTTLFGQQKVRFTISPTVRGQLHMERGCL